jgi:hypothetical protein
MASHSVYRAGAHCELGGKYTMVQDALVLGAFGVLLIVIVALASVARMPRD